MLSLLFFLLLVYLFVWLLPRVWLFFKTVYVLKKRIAKEGRDASFFHGETNRGPFPVEKDISHRVKIIEEKKSDT